MKLTFLKRKFFLGLYPKTILLLFGIALAIGLAGTWIPAFGYFPAIGHHNFSFAPWQSLFQHFSLPSALVSTLISGWGAAFISFILSLLITALSYNNRYWRSFQKALPAILATPHAAFAVGFVFLIAPSGWVMRLISPGISGFSYPPDWLLIKDPWGLSLMAALILKETPFLLFVIISALPSLKINQTLAVGKSLGYGTIQIWLKLILPRLYPNIRLSFFAVIAYSLSVVDISLIVGPTAPPTLAVLVLQWFNDPDLTLRLTGSAGACFLLIIVAISIGLVICIEKTARYFSERWYVTGKRDSPIRFFKPFSNSLLNLFSIISGGSLLLLIIWSFAQRWRFPDILPHIWNVRFWERA